MTIQEIFSSKIKVDKNYIFRSEDSVYENQGHTNDVFSEKWEKVDEMEKVDKLYEFQFEWYLKLYGFESEDDLKTFLQSKNVVRDCL